jgi:hypothetical protein
MGRIGPTTVYPLLLLVDDDRQTKRNGSAESLFPFSPKQLELWKEHLNVIFQFPSHCGGNQCMDIFSIHHERRDPMACVILLWLEFNLLTA